MKKWLIGMGLMALLSISSSVFAQSLPQIFLYSPENITYNYPNVTFNFTVIDDNSSTFQLKAWLNDEDLDEPNYANNTNIFINDTNLPPNIYNFTIWANDTDGNTNQTELFFSVIDNTSPTYSNNTFSTQYINSTITFANYSSDWSDDFGLDGYIFSYTDCVLNNWNFMNDSFVNDTSFWYYGNLTNKATAQKTLNCTPSCVFKWKWYVNDTSDNWNNTSEIGITLNCSPPTTTTTSTTTTIPPTTTTTITTTTTTTIPTTTTTTLELALPYNTSFDYCLDNSILMKNRVISITGLITESNENITCQWGCDQTGNACQTDPFWINIAVIVAVFLFLLLIYYIARRMRW